MKIKTFKASHLTILEAKLSELINDSFTPNLAFVFASVELDIFQVKAAFDKYKIVIFGASSCGEIYYDGTDDGIFEGSVTVSLVEMNPRFFAGTLIDGNGISSMELGKKVGAWGKSQFKKPAFLIAVSGLMTNGQEIVEGVLEVAGIDTEMFGGLAGDDANFVETFIFNNETINNNGAVAIAFDSDFVNIHGLATSGWVGIGSDKIVTKSNGNIVYTIDNEPALKVYKEHLSINDEDLPEIGVEYPLLVKKDNREVLRAVVGIDKEKQSLIFAGTVPQGAVVTFSTSPGFEIIDHTKKDIVEFFKGSSKVDLMLLFSCMARHRALGPVISEEIIEASRMTGLPINGFFTYGEIGNNGPARCDFYNETFTLALITEK